MTSPTGTAAPSRQLLRAIIDIAEAAGAITLKYFGDNPTFVEKPDKSPVTEADLAAEDLILKRLRRLAPNTMIVSEEADGDRDESAVPMDEFWLVDPLDGTKEFIAGRDEFTVNIGLIRDGRPILGVVHAPARALTYAGYAGFAIELAGGSERKIAARTPPKSGLIAVASRSHRTEQEDAVLGRYLIDRVVGAGSSLKFCLIAAGEADIYPRCGRTMEWDTAAGHAILSAAGGTVTTLEGTALGYGKTGFCNPYFIARGDFS
ncbi:MAG: 3'(2'),5'-bisphosphate nucleotidase CysQ [Alphaproteobacteria bacterium]|nr:3'(2'),5'-bisphosphate nucleotidase CysQ [Alphaproteobacteria bacterium]